MLPLGGPVLSLTDSAIMKMSGEDALCGLLMLFHKCKGGLQDGDRLENMVWRLWHVGRISSHATYLPTPAALSSPMSSSPSSPKDESDVSSDGETWDRDQASTAHRDAGASNYKAPSPTLSNSLTPFPVAPHGGGRRHSLKHEKLSRRSPSPVSAASRRTSPTRSRRPSLSSRRSHSNTSVGQFIADLIPEKLDLYWSPSLNALAEQNHWHGGSPILGSATTSEGIPAVVVMPDVEQHKARPSPPQVDQVSPPPASPTSCGVSLMPRRVTLTIVTYVRSPTSPTLPPTPESIGQKEYVEDHRQSLTPSLANAKHALLPPASCLRSRSSRSNGRGGNSNEQSSGILGAPGKSAVRNGTSIVSEFGAGVPSAGASGSSLNLPGRKVFIAQTSSPNGDSPDTRASEQVGSQSALSVNVAMLPTSDKRVVEAAAACEPANVALRASASTAHSHSSNGSSSRGGEVRMKSRKGTLSAKDKGKGKETRGLSQMHRTHSSGRIHRTHIGVGGSSGGTIQRSKLSGRIAAASVHVAGLASNQYAKEQSVRAPTSGVPMHPAPPAPVSKLAQAEKSTVASSSGARPGPAGRQSSSSQRSSRSGGSVKAGKASGHGPPSSSLNQRRLDFADDSDYSTDTEWDTEDVSEEADGTSGESEQAAVDHKLAEAAVEAQRQRDLFAKVDRRSYSDLSRVRTQPGLLSAMFHPDPQLFPPDHPYRHSRSTQDILAHTSRPSYQAAPLQPSKSTTAVPVAATVTAQGVGSPSYTHHRQRSPLRLKGRPQDVEESESGEDNDENKLHVSESVAERRLAMLQRQTMKGARAQESSKLAQHAPANRQVQQTNVLPAAGPAPTIRGGAPIPGPSPLARVATEPVPLGYPYNLPPPLPPSTPRTTRRNMLTHELSESMRRNLLWERQVSKQRPMGLGRRAVTNGAGLTVEPSNLRLLTSTTTTSSNTNRQTSGNSSQVGGSNTGNSTGNDAANGTVNGASTVDEEQSAKDKRLEKVIARNRSWADNYHAAGW